MTTLSYHQDCQKPICIFRLHLIIKVKSFWIVRFVSIYPNQLYKSFHLLSVIHSDMWRPSKINITGAKWFISYVVRWSHLDFSYERKNRSEADFRKVSQNDSFKYWELIMQPIILTQYLIFSIYDFCSTSSSLQKST